MGFGQPSGLPATASQLRELLALLHDVGHSDFRDARGPMRFTQRQAGGKFTRDEAAAFIEQLQQGATDALPGLTALAAKPSAADGGLSGFTSEQLAAELQRRGWIVVEP